jgi:hypothetical protein
MQWFKYCAGSFKTQEGKIISFMPFPVYLILQDPFI